MRTLTYTLRLRTNKLVFNQRKLNAFDQCILLLSYYFFTLLLVLRQVHGVNPVLASLPVQSCDRIMVHGGEQSRVAGVIHFSRRHRLFMCTNKAVHDLLVYYNST